MLRRFLLLLLGASALPRSRGPTHTQESKPEQKTIPQTFHYEFGICGICGAKAVMFDWGSDMHVCIECHARETAKGWQAR